MAPSSRKGRVGPRSWRRPNAFCHHSQAQRGAPFLRARECSALLMPHIECLGSKHGEEASLLGHREAMAERLRTSLTNPALRLLVKETVGAPPPPLFETLEDMKAGLACSPCASTRPGSGAESTPSEAEDAQSRGGWWLAPMTDPEEDEGSAWPQSSAASFVSTPYGVSSDEASPRYRDCDEPSPLRGISSGSVLLEKPSWMLEDGRLLRAALEGERDALRKAVFRARLENEELRASAEAAEAASRALQTENAAARKALACMSGFIPGSLAVAASSHTEACAGARAACDARALLLDTSDEVCRRADAVLARRELKSLCHVEAEPC